LGAEHCLLQLVPHCWLYPDLQASQYRVVHALVHALLADSLQSQLPVQLPLSWQFLITVS
jgi:hypothetical protein